MNRKFEKQVEKIKEELSRYLPEKVRHPALIMVCGLPGTGKSYFTRRLAERLPSISIQTDMIRRMLFPKPSYSPVESFIVYSVAHALIDEFLTDGYNVIFDATNLVERNRKKVYAIAEHHAAKLTIVWLEAPEEVVKERLKARVEGRFPSDLSEADWEVYEKMKATVNRIGREHYSVNTSQDITPVVEEIVDELTGQ